jgi:hypothetical protein
MVLFALVWIMSLARVSADIARMLDPCYGDCKGSPVKENVMLQTRHYTSRGKIVGGTRQDAIQRYGSIVYAWSPGCILGGGFGSGDGCTYPSAVLQISACDDQASAPNDVACLVDVFVDNVTSYSREARSSSDISKVLDATAKLEGRAYGTSVSAGAAVVKASNISESSVAFTIGAAGETRSTSVRNPGGLQLTEAAKELLRNDPLGFLGRYSHYYVYKITYGGSFAGAVTLDSKTSSSSSALDFTLDLSLPAELDDLSGDASVDFQRKVDAHSHEVDMNLQAAWLGGTGVQMESPATLEALLSRYRQWHDTWRSDPHPLKIVLRRWIDVHDVQLIVNTLDTQTRRVFSDHSVYPFMETLLRRELEDMQELQASLSRAMLWPELQSNRTAEFELMNLQFDVQRHMVEVEHLDEITMLRRQVEFMNRDDSWFTAYKLRRAFEDTKHAIGRICDDGSRIVDGVCVSWGGSCENGDLLSQFARTRDDHCGSCHSGYVLVAFECQEA